MKDDPLYTAVFMATFNAELRLAATTDGDFYKALVELPHTVALLAVEKRDEVR